MFLQVRYSRILLGSGSASIWCVDTEKRRMDRHRWHKLSTGLGALQNLTWPSLFLPGGIIKVCSEFWLCSWKKADLFWEHECAQKNKAVRSEGATETPGGCQKMHVQRKEKQDSYLIQYSKKVLILVILVNLISEPTSPN